MTTTTTSTTTTSTTTTSSTAGFVAASKQSAGGKIFWDPGTLGGLDSLSFKRLCGANVCWGYFFEALKKYCDKTGNYGSTAGFNISVFMKNTSIPLWERATDPFFVLATAELICKEFSRLVVVDFIIISLL